MKKSLLVFLSLSSLALVTANVINHSIVEVAAHGSHDHEHDHEHDEHEHDHEHDDKKEEKKKLTIIDPKDVEDRALTDWTGEWQSVYPYLADGTLDAVMAKKAEDNPEKTADEYKAYYEAGYKTDVDHINIDGEAGTISFVKGDTTVTGEYEYAGSKHLVYESGSNGVRYLFTKTGGDADAPTTIQFSDHEYKPTTVGHFHLYFSNVSHDELLEEMDNWPTYYPASMTAEDIEHEMLHH